MPVVAGDQMVSLRESEQIIDSLNEVAELEAGPDARMKFLLSRLRELLKRDGRAALTLLADLNHQPAPLVSKRIIVRPEWDHWVVADDQVQALWDDSRNVSSVIIEQIRSHLRHPFTIVCGEDARDPAWYRDILLNEHLKPQGYCDVIISAWAASEERAVYASLLRRDQEPPFSKHDRTLMSLMLRAVAPLADRELLRAEMASEQPRLSPRQREILGRLLEGECEKEIAHQLHRSIHTIHTHVRQIYDLFDVSSRGQLMALFIDRTVMSAMAGDGDGLRPVQDPSANKHD